MPERAASTPWDVNDQAVAKALRAMATRPALAHPIAAFVSRLLPLRISTSSAPVGVVGLCTNLEDVRRRSSYMLLPQVEVVSAL